MSQLSLRSTLFPYTTLFRSRDDERDPPDLEPDVVRDHEQQTKEDGDARAAQVVGDDQTRSEEHTSELQSHVKFVCRLLLEKKKKEQDKSLWRAIRRSEEHTS